MKKKQKDEIVSVNDFITHPEVKNCIRLLQERYGNTYNKLIVSDVCDKEDHQYVNLVQKGGGVLGIALVGYTYILEEVGIRFIRLAGTSAGAINTALMTVTGAGFTNNGNGGSALQGNKKIRKSEKILEEICDLNFFDLVDGHPVVKWLIGKFTSTEEDYAKKITKWITRLIISLVCCFILDFICLGLQHHFPIVALLTKLFFILTGFIFLLVVIIIVYINYLLTRLKDSGFGINPGDFFYDWIKVRMEANHVEKVSDLIAAAASPVDDLYLRQPNPSTDLSDLTGDVTFITSEIVTQNKIEFPKMWCLFTDDMNNLHPAGFVRASMAIPVFFESYFINNIPCKDACIRKNWNDTFGETDPPETVRFVDGGILSNFPMNLFYNPDVEQPRLPSFGIDLDDGIHASNVFPDNSWIKSNIRTDKEIKENNESKNAANWGFGGYLYRIFNTVRFYYDKDFLIQNKFFKKGVGTIPLQGFNWLNFHLSNNDKVNMFVLGALAATKFLLNDDGKGFNWEDYKTERVKMKKELDKVAGKSN